MEYDENTALNRAQFEDENSLNLIACRELIEMVKSNEFLWKKRCTSFKYQQMKNLCWTSIGSALTSVLSDKSFYKSQKIGAEAEKEFYKLRQKFGREVRKEKESAPRSGAGTGEPLYISEWPLYKDLEFLKDVIKPRRTTSNFSKSLSQKLSPIPSPPMCNSKTSMVHQRSYLTTPSPSSSPPIIIENSPSSSLWNSDLEGSLFSGSDGDTSSMSPGPSSVVSLKRSVPAPDSNYSKKKKIQDDMVSVLNKQATNLNVLTDTVTKYLDSEKSKNIENPVPPTIQQNSEDSLFLSVSAALAGVPQEKRLSCIIEVLQVVQKYTGK